MMQASRLRANVFVLLCAALLLGGVARCAAQGLTLYVATNGCAAWSGKLPSPSKDQTDGPFATLERARDEIRKLKAAGGLPKGGVTVALRRGTYERPDTFRLNKLDSGAADARILYTAYNREPVRITGGKAIGGFRKVSDLDVLARLDPKARGKVLVTYLPQQGVSDFGVLGSRRRQKPTAGLELFFNAKPMTLARWPNRGWAKIAGAPKGLKGGMFAYEGDRPARWVGEQDPRGCGFWAYDWAASHVVFESIDPAKKIITTRAPHSVYGYRTGGRFFAYNLLCELDEPGEWYLDRLRGLLYFWPPARITRDNTVVSICGSLIEARDASFVTFSGLTLEACRGTAAAFLRGEADALIGCTIRNVGLGAVTLNKGTGHQVIGCDIADANEGGILCVGGDKKTLTPCNYLIENNVVTRCSRWQHSHTNAVTLYTIGARVRHNLFYDIPHQALYFSGNDNIIEYNEVHSIGYEAGELGAFYAGRDWTITGNVVRYNYFHDIYNPCRQRDRGIMLDDGCAGVRMYGNLFVRVAEGISLSSINNQVVNNVFVHCRPAIGCWGGAVKFPKFDPEHGHNKVMWPRLVGLPLDAPPWSTRFPELRKLRDAIKAGANLPQELRGRIEHNIFWDTGEDIGFHYYMPKSHRWIHTQLGRLKDNLSWIIEDNLRGQDPLFVDAAKDDYRLKPESPALKMGFKLIPLDKIGPYKDARRASWPVQSEVRKDMTRDLTYVPPQKRKLHGKAPVFTARRAAAATIDGVISDKEKTGKPMMLEYDCNGGKVLRTSQAWLSHDGQALYIGIDNKVAAKPALKVGDKWGACDAVEVAVRASKAAPIVVLRGYATGHFESSAEAGATAEQAKAAAAGVRYAAKVVGPDRWVAEWSIPLASLGVNPAKPQRLAFNLTVRKTADNLWLMWVGTASHSWRVDLAGLVELGK